MGCIQGFSSERVLHKHEEICLEINGTQAVEMPDKDNNVLKFNNHHNQQKVPFAIYADIEAITEKITSCKPNSSIQRHFGCIWPLYTTPNNDKSYTEAYQKHTDCGYGYKVVCCYDDKYTKPVHRGGKAVFKFMEQMLEKVNYIARTLWKRNSTNHYKWQKRMKRNFKKLQNVIFVIINTLRKIFELKMTLSYYWHIQRISTPRL